MTHPIVIKFSTLQLLLGDGPRPFYELNLVLGSGERVYVIGHGNKKALKAEGETLSQFLGVPVLEGEVKYEEAEAA